MKRNHWKLGLVEELIEGKDGVIRGAKVRSSNKGKREILNRPLQKLIPLELQSVNGEEGLKDRKEMKETNVQRSLKPKRAAAMDARWKTRLALDSE